MAKVKRSQIATFVNSTPSSSTPTYKLLGVGVTTGKVNMNPKTTEETYIHEDTATITVDSYAPTQPVEMTIESTNDVFTFIDGLYANRSVLSDAETYIVEVDYYKSSAASAWPARKQKVSIQIDDKGGDGGQPAKINFTMNHQGAAVAGSFNPVSASFA